MKTGHNRLIAEHARAVLGSIGLKQKGRSRTWLDDHGWWVGVVEFQPSAYSKGSYLNVGANWLWYEKAHFSFDHGPNGGESRVDTFYSATNPEYFSKAAEHLAGLAKTAIESLRKEISSVQAVARALASKEDESVWWHYHSAVVAGLTGDAKAAQNHFQALSDVPIDGSWVKVVKERSAVLRHVVADTPRFRERVNEIIGCTRVMLKLPPFDSRNALEA